MGTAFYRTRGSMRRSLPARSLPCSLPCFAMNRHVSLPWFWCTGAALDATLLGPHVVLDEQWEMI